MSELTWTKQTFPIAFENGMQETEGFVAEGTGLGYHWDYEFIAYETTIDVCHVDHLASGRDIPLPTVRTETAARAWIEELVATQVDWMLPMEQLIVSPGYGELPAKCRKLAASIAATRDIGAHTTMSVS